LERKIWSAKKSCSCSFQIATESTEVFHALIDRYYFTDFTRKEAVRLTKSLSVMNLYTFDSYNVEGFACYKNRFPQCLQSKDAELQLAVDHLLSVKHAEAVHIYRDQFSEVNDEAAAICAQ
jgi:hypothetical protein